MIEQTFFKFHRQHAAHGFVQNFFGNRPLLHLLFQRVTIRCRNHFHVHARREAELRGIGFVGGDAVINQLQHRVIVAHDETWKFPFAAQNVRERVAIAARGKTRKTIERTHHRQRARVHAGFELRQIKISQRVFGNFRRVVIASAFRRTVTDKMFETRDHAICVCNICSLKTAHARRRIKRAEIRIFAETFRDAAPARVARQIYHRRKSPIHAGGRRFARGDGLRLLKQFRFPRARLRQRNRKRRAEAVDDVVPENQRHTEPALLDDEVLQFIPHHRRFDQHAAAKKRTDLAITQ